MSAKAYCKPQKRIGKYAVICFLLLASATASAIVGFEFHKDVFYALSTAFFFLSVQVFTVYILSSYEYVIEDGILYIYRVIGTVRKCIFDLDLNYAADIISCKDLKEYVKEKGKPEKRFYCLSGNKRKNCSALCYKTDMKIMLFFAPDELFISALRDYIR